MYEWKEGSMRISDAMPDKTKILYPMAEDNNRRKQMNLFGEGIP